MFCDYCRRLFEFKQRVEQYTPPRRRALLARGNENHVPQLKIETPSKDSKGFAFESEIKVYEDAKDLFTPPLLWWKVPVGQNGLRIGDIHTPRADCHICDMIFSSVSSSIVEALLSKENNVGFVYQLKGHDWKRTRSMIPEAALSVWLESGKQLLPMIQLSIVAQEYAEKLPCVFPSHVQSTYTGSAETLSLAASWIYHCNATHKKCLRIKPANPRLPTRLIDVGTSNGKTKPHLWITETGSEFVPYMTLSYRWGKSPEIMLTQASITELCEHIPVNLLPRSNQDAIQITRYLGIRYLWIDALCIIQDLDGDWHAESANMGNIYKNSYCTISASQAETGNRGCFVDRQPLQTHFSSTPLNVQNPPKRELPEKSSSAGNTSYRDMSLAEHSLKRLKRESVLDSDQEATSFAMSSTYQYHGSPDGTFETEQLEKEVSGLDWLEEEVPKIAQRLARHTRDRNIRRDVEQVQDRLQSLSKSELTIRAFQTDLWTSEVDSSPLSRRAWAFQERLLSPRILHFAKSQLFWECPTGKACETWPNPVAKGIADGPVPAFENNMFETKTKLALGGSVFDPVYEHWDKVVEFYTDAVLTRPQDKLIAMSGLANEALKDHEDWYCAGLWRNDFARNLLWYVQTPRKVIGPKPYCAPSWSWASIDGKVGHLARKPNSDHPTSMASTIETVYTRGVDG